jgi:hypothetical protein
VDDLINIDVQIMFLDFEAGSPLVGMPADPKSFSEKL